MTKCKYPKYSKKYNSPKKDTMTIKLKIKKITSLPTSTYHTTRYDSKTIFVAGSNWDRKKVNKPGKTVLQKVFYFVCKMIK